MLPNEMSSDTSNALRVQSTRSSTGCQTCKNRRIKCDEGRPRCQKCLKSNRLCSYSAHQSDSWKKLVVYPTPGASRPSPTPPDLVPSEQRALYYFRCHAAKRITAPFRSELWVDCIFQLTESYDFVQSALVAFSTMHESFTQSPEARTRLQHVAERHYNKALSHISNAKQSDLSVDAVLVACIIFYSLESLRGAIYRALQHAHSGIKIMRDNQHRPSPPFPGETALTGALFRDFLALQNQVDELSDSTTCRAYDSVEGFAPRICDQFVSIEDALHHVEILHNEVYCLGDYCARLQQNNNNLDELFPTEIAPRYEKIVRRFDHWSHGIAKLEATTQNNPADPTFSGHLILKIYESIGRCMLSMFSSSDCFNTYDPGLAHGIDQIERFLDHQSTEANDEHQTFSVSIGVIPLLFTLCYRCNNLALRDRSMQLLRRSKRREGLWDSEMAVAMAARVISLKDDLAASGRPETSATVQVSEISFVSEDVVQMTLIYSDPDNAVTADKSFVSFDGPELTRRVEVMKLSTVLVQPS